jgi:hypothetical protein
MYSSQVKIHQDQELMNEVVNAFLSEKPQKTVFGNFRIEGDKLVYRTQKTIEASGRSNHEVIKEAIRLLKSGKAKLYQNHPDTTLDGILKSLKDGNYERFKYQTESTDIIALKVSKNLTIGNSSVLTLVGRTVAYGHESLNRGQTLIQRKLNERIPMVPFNVFAEAKLNLKKMKMIERGKDEHVQEKVRANPNWEAQAKYRMETRHFTGASLFEVEGKYFLFDIDRREIKHGIFNPFLVELNRKCSSILEAYEILKPKEVLNAEAKGLKIKRQGEWFFIPCKKPNIAKLSTEQKLLALLSTQSSGSSGIPFGMENIAPAIGKDFIRFSIKKGATYARSIPQTMNLRAGQNRPNRAEQCMQIKNETFVTGLITHSGREHAPLKLTQWYKAIPNTSVRSFTITGDVD